PRRTGHPWAFGVRRVAEEPVAAPVSELCEPPDVRLHPVDGRVVDIVVARVEDSAGLRLDHHGDVVRDRMRHPDELKPESAEIQRWIFGPDLLQLRGPEQPVLVELRLDESERQPGGPDLRDRNFAQQVGQRADVMLVPVRDEECANPFRALAQVGEVRQDEIHAEMLVPRERQPGVDDQALAVDLENSHVLADLAEAAERDDSERAGHDGQSSCPLSKFTPFGEAPGDGTAQNVTMQLRSKRISPREAIAAGIVAAICVSVPGYAQGRSYRGFRGTGASGTHVHARTHKTTVASAWNLTKPLAPVTQSAPVVSAQSAPAPAQSAASSDPGKKIDKTLAAVAQQAQAQGGPQALVHVIASGSNPGAPLARLGAADIEYLSLINAYTGTIRAADLSALAHAPEINRIPVHSPLKMTGTTT